MLFVSSTQVNAQLPYNIDGNATMVLRTPGGISDNFNFTIQSAAPSIFRSGTAGPETGIATVFRAKNGQLVTLSNPVHFDDELVIYATGLGRTSPPVEAGQPAPGDTPAVAIIPPEVDLGGVPLDVVYAGLTPGTVGVYQINVVAGGRLPEGMDVPLTIKQPGGSTTLSVRVVR